MINYIIQVLLFQTVFLAVYDLVLKKETFFQWNRAYLLVTTVLAYLLPLIKFQTIAQKLSQEYMMLLPEVMLSPTTYIEKQIDWSEFLFTSMRWIFLVGIVMSIALFAYKLWQINRLISKNRSKKYKEYNLVLHQENNVAFSFFRYIFIGRTLTQKKKIILHELVHVKQKHSIDLLFFEIQKIVLWFNPYGYIYQNRIAEIHEFIADTKTVNTKEKSTFYNGLLAETFAVDKFAFVNAFNKQSLIKKRIIMFSKEKSKEFLKFKYLLLLPVLMGMLVYTSCETNSIEKLDKQTVQKNVNIFMYSKNKPEGNLVSFDDLSKDEKTEYKSFDNSKFSNPDIYRLKNGEIGYYYDDEAMSRIQKSDLSKNTFIKIFN